VPHKATRFDPAALGRSKKRTHFQRRVELLEPNKTNPIRPGGVGGPKKRTHFSRGKKPAGARARRPYRNARLERRTVDVPVKGRERIT